MQRYIVLLNWTDQGIKNVKESAGRIDANRALAKKYGCDFKDLYMTVGTFDLIAVVDAPDDEAFAKYALMVGASGNVRTTTLKAFSEDAYRNILAGL